MTDRVELVAKALFRNVQIRAGNNHLIPYSGPFSSWDQLAPFVREEYLSDAKAALAALWQPIETAPKTDEPVLVWDPDDSKTSDIEVYAALPSDREHNEYWRLNGDDGYPCYPTHWMPLLEPPK